MLVPLYDTATGEFKGIKQTLGYVISKGNHNGFYFTYGFCKEKSSSLFSASKQVMPNMLVDTTFETHVREMMNERATIKSS